MNYTFAALPVTMIDIIWDKLLPHIKRVVMESHDSLTEEICYDKIKSGRSLCLAVCLDRDIIAVSILEVIELENDIKALGIPIAAGEGLFEWGDAFFEVVKAIAKDLNCTELRAEGARKGWVKPLKARGWQEMNVTLQYQLAGE